MSGSTFNSTTLFQFKRIKLSTYKHKKIMATLFDVTITLKTFLFIAYICFTALSLHNTYRAIFILLTPSSRE